MQVSVDSQQAAKRKLSFVKKVAKAVKTKSQKLCKKLCSAVVRPQTTQKQYAKDKCRLIQVSLGVYRVFQMFFWPAEFPGYHQCQQESQ